MHHKLASCLLVEHAFNHALNFRGDVCFDVCFTLKYPSRGYKGIFSFIIVKIFNYNDDDDEAACSGVQFEPVADER